MSQTLTLSETARSLMARASRAILGSLSDDGYPFSSLVEVAPLPNGDCLLLMSDLAQHSKNLKLDSKASLLLTDDANSSLAFATGRATLSGGVSATADAAPLELWHLAHPKSVLGGFHDFKLYVFAAERAHVIAGFGRVGRVELSAYREAQPDLLAGALRGMVAHMNEDHRANLLDYAHALLEKPWASDAVLIGMDRYGMDLYLSNADQSEVARYSFDAPLETSAGVRPLLVSMAREARVKLGKAEPTKVH